jgi:hypothetical protein
LPVLSPDLSCRRAHRDRLLDGDNGMDDIIWLTVIAGLAAATLAYVRLCDAA